MMDLKSDSDPAELYCAEKATFTSPFNSVTDIVRKQTKRIASTPYYQIQLPDKDESQWQITSSSDDPIINQPRVLHFLLKNEAVSVRATSQYLHTTNINDTMRKILLRWMYEVVIEQKCEDLIFVLSANYLDRILATVPVLPGQLQLLGCCCLMLACKLRNCVIISAEMLSELTDGSHTEDEICKFELVVLGKLGWDMSPVLATDYLEPVIRQGGLCHLSYVRRHATSFLSMVTLYSQFLDYRPSFLACASIYASLTYTDSQAPEEPAFLSFVCSTFSITQVELAQARDLIYNCMNQELSLQEQESNEMEGMVECREADTSIDIDCALLRNSWLQQSFQYLRKMFSNIYERQISNNGSCGVLSNSFHVMYKTQYKREVKRSILSDASDESFILSLMDEVMHMGSYDNNIAKRITEASPRPRLM